MNDRYDLRALHELHLQEVTPVPVHFDSACVELHRERARVQRQARAAAWVLAKGALLGVLLGAVAAFLLIGAVMLCDLDSWLYVFRDTGGAR